MSETTSHCAKGRDCGILGNHTHPDAVGVQRGIAVGKRNVETTDCTCVGRDSRQTHGVGCPLGPATVEEFLSSHTKTDQTDWPARAYVYGTWGYALSQATERARNARQRMYLYRGVLDGEPLWVVSWDPRPRGDA